MAAFKGTITTQYAPGRPGPSYRFSASDVAAAFVTFDDVPGTPAFIQPGPGLKLADITVSAVGGTVVALQLSKGTSLTDKILRIGPLLETLAGMDGRTRLGSLYNQPFEPLLQYGLKQL